MNCVKCHWSKELLISIVSIGECITLGTDVIDIPLNVFKEVFVLGFRVVSFGERKNRLGVALGF